MTQKTMGQIMADTINAGEKPDHDKLKAALKRQLPMATKIRIKSHEAKEDTK